MKTKEVIKYFGSKNGIAQGLKLRCPNSIYTNWKEYPPIARQWQIELITNGALKAESYYDSKIPAFVKFIGKLTNEEKAKLKDMILKS